MFILHFQEIPKIYIKNTIISFPFFIFILSICLLLLLIKDLANFEKKQQNGNIFSFLNPVNY